MKPLENYEGFEQGPIRPPSEAGSLLIRITRNCPWNRCTFCPVYKGTTFSRRPVEHVLKDIDTVADYVKTLQKSAGPGGQIPNSEMRRLVVGIRDADRRALHAAYNFITNGMQSIFLQDGNSLVIKPDDLVRILEHLRNEFPMVERVTSYARSQTIARISDEDLSRMAAAGLNRIHIGMESGSDEVLKQVHKGTDKAKQILAGRKIKRAGMELSEYYMPGLGGRDLWRENAVETADALNQINPDFIRLRTLALPDAAPITEAYNRGEFQKMGDVETARELLLFLESLDGITSTVKSDHILNLFQEVEGTLPHDKDKMIGVVRDYLELDPQEQMLFSIGRRTFSLATPDDLHAQEKRRQVEQTVRQLGATPANMDEHVEAAIKRFI